MTVEVSVEDYLDYIDRVAEKIKENEDYITDLDSATGDGDHWVNLNMGFQRLIENRADFEELDFGDLFKRIGMMLMSTIGGSSGVLYGSAYIEAGKVVEKKQVLNIDDIQKVIEAKMKGIMTRGKTEYGDKTMVDSIYQANEYMKEAIKDKKPDEEILKALRDGAKFGMEATKDMEAKRGRAYYQDNKGVGHLDPGAVTMYYQIDKLVETILNK